MLDLLPHHPFILDINRQKHHSYIQLSGVYFLILNPIHVDYRFCMKLVYGAILGAMRPAKMPITLLMIKACNLAIGT